MSDRRWGFEDDEGDHEPAAAARQERASAPDQPGFTGTDQAETVTVEVDPDGQVVAARLAGRRLQPDEARSLGSAALEAVNAATASALAAKIESTDMEPVEQQTEAESPTDHDEQRDPERDRFAELDSMMELLDVVSAELDEFDQRLNAVTTRTVRADSAGGHVTAHARSGQLVGVDIDPRWAGSVRASEVEVELRDALQRAQRESSPGDLAQGPQSPAITELNQLVANPQAFLGRLGLAD